MELSENGLDLIKVSEGFRAETYNDVNGFPTIGYGHKLMPPESFPAGITPEQGATILESDVQAAVGAVRRMVTVPLTQGQFDALVDFTFNLGGQRLQSSTLLRLLNAGNYAGAEEQFIRWNIAAGKPNAGLTARREAEAQLFNS